MLKCTFCNVGLAGFDRKYYFSLNLKKWKYNLRISVKKFLISNLSVLYLKWDQSVIQLLFICECNSSLIIRYKVTSSRMLS